MLFRAALTTLFAAAASASIVPGDVPATSKLGQRILSKATEVTPARHLEQNDRDVTFVGKYSLRYLSCSSLVQVSREGQGGEEGMLYTQHLVKFTLCPTTESCSSCKNGGEYVMAMEEFVDMYTEFKLTEKEYQCEMIRENCYCDNANDDEVCENQCYVEQGMEECIEYEGQEEFEAQRYLECAEMEDNGNNNNNNNNGNWNQGDGYYGQYFIGPYCNPKDGKSIHLGVFYDEGCTARADSEVYASKNYGAELPFSKESMVKNDCIDCKQVDQDNNNNNNNNNQNNQNAYYQEELEVTEICEKSYEIAARCEDKMEIQYKDTSGCDYISNILPRLEAASRNIDVGGGSSGGKKAAVTFAVLFAMTTALFAGYAYFLYRKIKRGSVNLASQE